MELTLAGLSAAESKLKADGVSTVGAFGQSRETGAVDTNADGADRNPARNEELVRAEIALPLKLNDGTTIDAAKLGDVYVEITRKFNGLTLWPSLGLSLESSRAEIDEHLWLTIILPRNCIGALISHVRKIKKTFNQRQVFWLVSPVARFVLSDLDDQQEQAAAE
jgi:hypothetical protein